MRARRRAAVAFVVAALLLSQPLAAAADPPGPAADPPGLTDDDVAGAHRAVDDAEQSVAQLEVRLAEIEAAAEEATVAVQRAGEAYTRALAAAQAARQRADDTRDRSARADEATEDARLDLMVLARQAARTGGQLDALEAALSADGFADIAHRTGTLSHLTGKADETVQTFRAAQLVATTLSKRADAAARAADEAEATTRAALAAATQAQADAQRALDAANAEREVLLQLLAAARETSTAVERGRHAALDEQRQARDEAVALGGAGAPGAGADSSYAPYGLGTGRSAGTPQRGLDALAWAMSQLGKPYGWGAAGPDAFDCSGLTMASWRAAGVDLARTSRDQYRQVLRVSYAELRPGDLVFWTDDPTDTDAVYHVAMWAGAGKVVEAPRPGVPLRLAPMRWGSVMPYAGRP